MLDILLDSVIDTLKSLPFLLGAYLLIECMEHRASGKLTQALGKLGPLGPVGGALLGCVPQCGFSVAAANLYAGRLITPGTLIAVFLATSDEALPILLSRAGAGGEVLRLLGVKLAAAALAGILADFVAARLPGGRQRQPFQDLCQDCGCEERGIFLSALSHTLRVFLFLLGVNLALGLGMAWVGEERLSRLLLTGSR